MTKDAMTVQGFKGFFDIDSKWQALRHQRPPNHNCCLPDLTSITMDELTASVQQSCSLVVYLDDETYKVTRPCLPEILIHLIDACY
jgi:hypothetical protein